MTDEYDSAKDGLDSYYAAIEAKRVAGLVSQRDEAIEQFADTCIAARQRVRELEDALRALVDCDCSYDGSGIRIPTNSHGDAVGLVSRARAVLARRTL